MYFTKIFIILAILLAVCCLKAEEFNQTLDGNYIVSLNIQGKVFQDRMTLKGLNEPIKMVTFGGPITGTMTVPGMFSSEITGTGHCTLWGSFCDFNFSITANENGQSYKVIYKMSLNHEQYMNIFDGKKGSFEGDAFLENNELLGHFQAVRDE